jgi:hypothetical protein
MDFDFKGHNSEACRRHFVGRIMDRVRDRSPHQTPRQLINSIRHACAGLRDMCESQREAMVVAGHQLDAEKIAIEDVLLEELESWFDPTSKPASKRTIRARSRISRPPGQLLIQR